MIIAASLSILDFDDTATACREVKELLDEKCTLLRNSVGIIQCAPEFIEAGLLKTLYETLGIPLVGGVTMASATNDSAGDFIFSMLVLTSDDVEFAVSCTQGLEEDCAGAIERALKATLNASKNPAKLSLVFPAILEDLSVNSYLEAIENACGNIPIFGTNPIDVHFPIFTNCLSICNGEAFAREMSYVLLSGNVNPRFFVAAVPTQAGLSDVSVPITRAQGNVIYEIDHISAVQYLESLGLVTGGKLKNGAFFLPLLISEEGIARPFIRALTTLDEHGCAICSGDVPQGAQIAFGSYSGADVMESTTQVLTQLAQEPDASAILIFSCIVRQFVIGIDSMRELNQIRSMLPASTPFIASYAGGEICPLYVSSSHHAHNCFHNYSFVACVL